MNALSLIAALWTLTATPPATAPVDLSRYTGTWYELARFDTYFERGCVGTTATYALEPDGRVSVLNRCFEDTLDGKEKRVTGKAWVPDASEPGKLRVQFFWPFHAPYWVLEVAPDYSWALVGHPERKTCWIMSRAAHVPEPLFEQLVGKLAARGYDVKKLVRVPQR